MKLGRILSPGTAPDAASLIDQAKEAEELGYHSVWSAEIYGLDCFTPLAWVGAHTSRIKLGTSIMQISARTPASAAMHAVALDHLSGGRLILGIGVSGPQVVEGWYGQPYPKPLARTREWVEIFRKIVAREEPVAFEGAHYQLPLDGGTGLGKPLKLMHKPVRDHIPVYLGAEGPKNVALSAEICDGWIPMFLAGSRIPDLYPDMMKLKGPDFEIAATVPIVIDDDIDKARAQIKQNVGFYVGGMGAKTFNVHKDHVTRMGYGDAAQEIQDLFMSGKRAEAMAAVPDALVDEIALCGPKERVRELLSGWKNSEVTEMIVMPTSLDTAQFLAQEVL